MLLKQLINSAKTASNFLVYDPFGEPARWELVKEVIGLANADIDGPRAILFGINPAAVEGDGIVGISETAAAELKRAHRLVSGLIEPALDLAFIYDRINGKLVGALEIDGCEFGPYFVGQDFSDELCRGACWLREGRELRAVERADLLGNRSPLSAAGAVPVPEEVDVRIGFNDRPDCHYLEMSIPDTSNPPFAEELEQVRRPSTIVQAIKDTVDSVTTQIQRLAHGSSGAPADGGPFRSSTDATEDEAARLFADAQNHYYFEERAVKLELCIRNDGKAPLEDTVLELGFPRIADFDVADRLYANPFDKRSANEIKTRRYPRVENRKDAIFVRSEIAPLDAGGTQPALSCPLRMALRPGMQGRKLGIRYTLRGPDGRSLSQGQLKIRFGGIADG